MEESGNRIVVAIRLAPESQVGQILAVPCDGVQRFLGEEGIPLHIERREVRTLREKLLEDLVAEVHVSKMHLGQACKVDEGPFELIGLCVIKPNRL